MSCLQVKIGFCQLMVSIQCAIGLSNPGCKVKSGASQNLVLGNWVFVYFGIWGFGHLGIGILGIGALGARIVNDTL